MLKIGNRPGFAKVAKGEDEKIVWCPQITSMIKRNLGSALRSRSYWAQCREMMMLAMVHNIMILLFDAELFYRAGGVYIFFAFRSHSEVSNGAGRFTPGKAECL